MALDGESIQFRLADCDEKMLETFGIKLRDANGNYRPKEIAIQEFMDNVWPVLTEDQKISVLVGIALINYRQKNGFI